MNEITSYGVINPISDEPAWGTMQPGWNLMGWTGDVDYMNISDAIPLIYGNWSKNITRVWHYANNTDVMEPYWPENSSAQFHPIVANTSGEWTYNYDPGYWVCVEDDSNRGYCETSEPPLMPWQNQRPTLYNGSVNNTNAKTTDSLEFTVYYKDPDGDSPSPINVVIDGVPYAMSPATTTFDTGALVTTDTASIIAAKAAGDPMSSGDHYFYFEAGDGLDHTFYDGTNTTKYPKIPYEQMLWYHVNYLPTPIITVNETSTKVGNSVQFNASDSYDQDGIITAYYWDFGDGTNSTEAEPTHVYTSPGTYNVTLTVWDDMNESNTTSVVITVNVNQAPVAVARVTHLYAMTYSFDASESYDSDGTISKVLWDFGDGKTSTETIVKHAYELPGIYTVRLTVWDDDGVSATTSTTVKIEQTSLSSSKTTTENGIPYDDWLLLHPRTGRCSPTGVCPTNNKNKRQYSEPVTTKKREVRPVQTTRKTVKTVKRF